MSIKSLIPYELKIRTLLFLMKFKKNPYFHASDLGSGRKIFMFLTADYGNLGDVAISYAQADFVKKNFPELEIVDVPISKTVEGMFFARQNIKKGDLVATNGGGNLGDLYPDIESLRQLVIETLPNNRVISFPQTIDFGTDELGKEALNKAQQRYGNHKSLVFMAREKRSYEKMKREFRLNTVLLSPDIVMSLDKSTPVLDRKGVVICLRNDLEKRLTSEEDAALLSLIERKFDRQSAYDTHIGRGNLSASERNMELDKIWTVVRGADLVITDRLHGMIFSFITGTPCLVFLNSNNKILDSYEWIKAASYISLVSEFSIPAIESLMDKHKSTTAREPVLDLSAHYKGLVEAMTEHG